MSLNLLLDYTRGAEWPRRGDRFFGSFLITKIVPLSAETYFLGSQFLSFASFLTTKIVPLSGETYFLGPDFGDFSQKCSFLDHFENPKSMFHHSKERFS